MAGGVFKDDRGILIREYKRFDSQNVSNIFRKMIYFNVEVVNTLQCDVLKRMIFDGIKCFQYIQKAEEGRGSLFVLVKEFRKTGVSEIHLSTMILIRPRMLPS